MIQLLGALMKKHAHQPCHCTPTIIHDYPLMLRSASIQDAAAIAAICNHYVSNTTVTFEEKPITAKAMAHRIAEGAAQLPWYVFDHQGEAIHESLGFRQAAHFHRVGRKFER